MKKYIVYYGAVVHFKNMGNNDELFDQQKHPYGGYAYLLAKVDSESTFKKIIENYADEYQTGIISINDIQQKSESNVEELDHYLGIYSNNTTNTYPSCAKDNNFEQPYHAPLVTPVWRSADVILKKSGEKDEFFLRIQEAEKAKIHVLAKTTTEDLFVRLMENYVEDYHSEIVSIDNIQIEESINNIEMVHCKDQYMGIYSDGSIEILD